MAKRKASTVKSLSKRTQADRSYVSRPLSTVYNQAAIADHSDAVRAEPLLASLGLPPVEQPAHRPSFRVLCVMPELETPRKVYEHFDDLVGDLTSQIQDALDEGDVARAADADTAWIAATKRRDITANFRLQERMLALSEVAGFTVDVVGENHASVAVEYEFRLATRFVDPSTYDVVFIDADDRFAMALANCGAKRVVLVGDTKNQPRAVAPTLTALYGVISEEIAIRNQQLGLDWATPLPTVPTLDSHDAAVDAEIVRLAHTTR